MSTDSDYFLYTNAEYLDMCYCVFQSNDDIPAGRIRYQEKFPNRHLPSENVFETILHRLKTTGSFHPPLSEPTRLRSGRIRKPIEPVEDNLDGVTAKGSTDDFHQNEPNQAVLPEDCRHTNQAKTTGRPLHRTLPNLKKPYVEIGSRDLFPSEYEPRLKFCQWYIDHLKEDPKFAQRILWSDEVAFTRDCVLEGYHFWSCAKPKAGKEPNWEVNVWAGIIGTKLIGPIFLPSDPKVDYLDIILKSVEDHLKEMPMPERKKIILQHSEVPPSWKNALDEHFPVWIGAGGPVSWPTNSMDLCPVHYFLWAHFKKSMLEKTCKSKKQMKKMINTEFEMLRSTPNLIANAIKSTHRRATLCVECEGQNFSFLL